MNTQKLETAIELAKENTEQFTAGQLALMRAHRLARSGFFQETETLTLPGFLWEEELEGLLAAMNEFEIKEITFIEHSTAAMKTMHFFLEKGATLKSTLIHQPITNEEPMEHKGITITLP